MNFIAKRLSIFIGPVFIGPFITKYNYSIAPTGQAAFASSYFFNSSGVSGCLRSLALGGAPSTLKSLSSIATHVPHPMHWSFIFAIILCNQINVLSFYRPPWWTFIISSFIRNDVRDVHRYDDALSVVLRRPLLRRRALWMISYAGYLSWRLHLLRSRSWSCSHFPWHV